MMQITFFFFWVGTLNEMLHSHETATEQDTGRYQDETADVEDEFKKLKKSRNKGKASQPLCRQRSTMATWRKCAYNVINEGRISSRIHRSLTRKLKPA